MSQTPNNGRVRRVDRYASRPEDVTPTQPRRTQQPRQAIGRSAELQARHAQSCYQAPVYSDFPRIAPEIPILSSVRISS